MLDQYSRTQLLLGKDGIARLHSARVAVFGIGGVGSYTVEALARVMRKELRKRGIRRLKVVYSQEQALTPLDDMAISCRSHCICPPRHRPEMYPAPPGPRQHRLCPRHRRTDPGRRSGPGPVRRDCTQAVTDCNKLRVLPL